MTDTNKRLANTIYSVSEDYGVKVNISSTDNNASSSKGTIKISSPDVYKKAMGLTDKEAMEMAQYISVHEAGHIKYSDFSALTEFVKKQATSTATAQAIHGITNVVEDFKIDTLNEQAFEGIRDLGDINKRLAGKLASMPIKKPVTSVEKLNLLTRVIATKVYGIDIPGVPADVNKHADEIVTMLQSCKPQDINSYEIAQTIIDKYIGKGTSKDDDMDIKQPDKVNVDKSTEPEVPDESAEPDVEDSEDTSDDTDNVDGECDTDDDTEEPEDSETEDPTSSEEDDDTDEEDSETFKVPSSGLPSYIPEEMQEDIIYHATHDVTPYMEDAIRYYRLFGCESNPRNNLHELAITVNDHLAMCEHFDKTDYTRGLLVHNVEGLTQYTELTNPYELASAHNKGTMLGKTLEALLRNKRETPMYQKSSGKGLVANKVWKTQVKDSANVFNPVVTETVEDTCIYAMLDASGSQYGNTRGIRSLIVTMIQACSVAGINLCIQSFCTSDSVCRGGGLITHIVDFDTKLPTNPTQQALLATKYRTQDGNADLGALAYAEYVISKRTETNKLVFFLSDGMPSDSPGSSITTLRAVTPTPYPTVKPATKEHKQALAQYLREPGQHGELSVLTGFIPLFYEMDTSLWLSNKRYYNFNPRSGHTVGCVMAVSKVNGKEIRGIRYSAYKTPAGEIIGMFDIANGIRKHIKQTCQFLGIYLEHNASEGTRLVEKAMFGDDYVLVSDSSNMLPALTRKLTQMLSK